MYKLHTVFTDLKHTHAHTEILLIFKTHREAERTYQYIYTKVSQTEEKAVTEYT